MSAASSLELALESCVLADRTDLARLRATGRDILGLLHRLSTQDVNALPVGRGAPTVLTSAKGRIVERVFLHRVADREVLLVAGAGRADAVLAHLRKYTFAEDTGLSDVTAETVQYAFVGPKSAEALARVNLPDPGPYGAVRATLNGASVVVLGIDGLGGEGRSIVAPAADAPAILERVKTGAPEADAGTLEAWRILRGLPGSGTELTEDWNPLEAGLRDHVSFTKGCYVGQEVVARLNTYDKVSRRLIVVKFPPGSAVPEPGAEIFSGERAVGKITSATSLPGGGVVALGFVKSRDWKGAALSVGGAECAVVNP